MLNKNAGPRTWRPLLSLLAALLLLNSMLTFHNLWPTPYVHWVGELSIDLACVVLLLVVWRRFVSTPPRALLVTLAVLFVIGTIGRYAAVTAQALYGREVNLFWDLPHVSSLVGMLVHAVSIWLLLAIVFGTVALLALLYYVSMWCVRSVVAGIEVPQVNAVFGIVAIGVICWFTLQQKDDRLKDYYPRFSIPVTQAYASQVVRSVEAFTGSGAVAELPRSPAFTSTLASIQGSDVMVVFLESYGRVNYDRAEFFQTLAGVRSEVADAAHATGRTIVSGFVSSPTFGGGSWMAHLSFMSGIEIRDPARGQLLMTQRRDTIVSEFNRHGYRTVALMPGLKNTWPEGRFYRFNQVYDDASLNYNGPAFGWWRIPDQFSLAQLDAVESAPHADGSPRRPLFTVFPTISMHTPFRPTPPYQPDWSRLMSATPFDSAPLQQSLVALPEWDNMSTSYVGAVTYSLQTLAGYLHQRANRDLTLVVLGDHQPPAMVSGEEASWDVPVHIITSKPAVLEALRARGFVDGMVPAAETLGPMHELAPTLMAVFESEEKTAS